MGDASPDDQLAASLEGVVDDASARDEWTSWACDELAGGRSADDVAAELVAGGWTPGDAIPFARPSMFGALGGFIRGVLRLWSTREVGRRKR